MTTILVKYHQELDSWWAESPDVLGWTAVGADVSEVRALAREGLPFFLDTDTVDLLEEGPVQGQPVISYDVRSSFGFNSSGTAGVAVVRSLRTTDRGPAPASVSIPSPA